MHVVWKDGDLQAWKIGILQSSSINIFDKVMLRLSSASHDIDHPGKHRERSPSVQPVQDKVQDGPIYDDGAGNGHPGIPFLVVGRDKRR